MKILQPRLGDRVRVRQRLWVVQAVDSYEGCRILTLSGAHDGAAHTCRVIQPFDDVEPARTSRAPKRVGIRRWRRACRALIAEDGSASGLRTIVPARIELLPYQLEPALALLDGRGSRLLIADEVGLGKTVQAMLAVSELRARSTVTRVLVVCPAGLREQWADECATRFALPFAIMDQPGVRRARTRLPAGVNPWSTEPLVVASVDYLKRPEVLPAVLAAGWDAVVVDEAHGVCGQSERHHAVSRLCRSALFVVLLTATPHNGDEEAFASLCSLGQHDDAPVVFRRTRLEAGRDAGRRAHVLRIAITAAERRMHAALAALTRAIRRESADPERNVWLMLSLLHKRAFSSPYALAASAERRLRMLGDEAVCGEAQLPLPLDDESGELDGADSAPLWGLPALRDTGRERRLLEQLIGAARQAEGLEGKLHRLHRLLRVVREPVIIFTEYRDTLLHVRNQVAPGAAIVHGGMSRQQRRAALEAFPSAGVLLATDAAGEGLNLQEHCRAVVNLELPWNPMRLEQRIGRVDRIGQRRRVHVFHLVCGDTGEARLLARLSTRVAQAQVRVGAPDPLSGRPEWTEEASARLIVFRHDAPATGPSATTPAVSLTRLQPEGEHEANRARMVRALSPPGTTAASGGASDLPAVPLVAWTRRRLRHALHGGTLAVFRTAIMDDDGRIVATRVDGAICKEVRADASGVAHLAGLSPAVPEAFRHDGWRRTSLGTHERTTTLRLHRARTIAALLGERHAERQPGLFDRRAEEAWKEQADELNAARAHAAERVVRAEAALRVRVSSPELALVLFPCRPASPL
jgi:superfamily II DNA or RNA helicase